MGASAIVALISLVGSVQAKSQDVGAAARAYQAGQVAHLEENFARAAEYFELAHRLAPNSTALRSAARARLAAGHHSAAAQLAETLLTTYADEEDSVALAEAILGEVASRVGRVEVRCDAPCVPSVDGRAQLAQDDQTRHVLYARPGRHEVEVSFGEGMVVREAVVVRRRAETTLSVERPSALAEADVQPASASDEADLDGEGEASELPESPHVDTRRRLPVGWFIASSMATLAVGGFAIWSGRDVLNAHDRFLEMPTREGLDDGRSRELRTNILFGATGVLAVTTVVIGVMTEWRSEREAPVALELSPEGGVAAVRGSF